MTTCRTLTNDTKLGLAALFLFGLSGCQSTPVDGVTKSSSVNSIFQSGTPYQKLNHFAAERGGVVFAAAGTPFSLTAVSKVASKTPDQVDTSVLTVYIEGDGRAWITSSMPSSDPSPRSFMMAQKALEDTQPSIYLARPCQFQKTESPSCNMTLWTSDRFSSEVVASYSQALDQIKRYKGVKRFHLVGYSGGAAVAMALAGQRQDIEQVVTLAGNVDPLAWIERQNLSRLGDVVNPLDYSARLSNLPQRHYVGAKDKVVPPDMAKAFVGKIKASCADIVEMPFTHEDGWGVLSTTDLSRPIDCH
ncbi:alpha/beta hydrolase (plasmid) [Pseudomonas silesiensis]|uniref:alpha/beta fold hydrolase n=1 Tax=Pseudomonas silesiensis TaxID=1853130 RepID=UPI0030D342F1